MKTEQTDPRDTFAGMGRTSKCVICDSDFKQRYYGKKMSKTCSKECMNVLKSRTTSGVPKTFEHVEKIRRALTGKIYSIERRAAIGKGREGKCVGPTHWNWNSNRQEVISRKALRRIMGGILRHTLEFAKKNKNGHTCDLLGYSSQQLRVRLEALFKPGMTWENHGYGDNKWHVDHVRPVSKWPPDALPSEVNALSNLQPMWQHENFVKGKTWEGTL
jgi:hypothetical protein